MPTEAFDIYTTIFKNGTGTFMARIVGADGTPVDRSAIASIHYSVYQLNDADPNARQAMTGHENILLNMPEVLFDALQTDAVWTYDRVGYNFRHELDVSTNVAFPMAGCHYLVEYSLRPLVGQPILVRFRVHVI